jgi:broad specificity phosphatase PhoE
MTAIVCLHTSDQCYLDVIHRLQSMIIELERMTQSCLIVTHRVVMRILLGYLLDWTHDEMVRWKMILKDRMVFWLFF